MVGKSKFTVILSEAIFTFTNALHKVEVIVFHPGVSNKNMDEIIRKSVGGIRVIAVINPVKVMLLLADTVF